MAETITVNNIVLPATACTPEVAFDFTHHLLRLTGESYPENAAAFYRPLIGAVEAYARLVRSRPDVQVAVHVALSYFNSSSTKMLFTLFEVLNNMAGNGTAVVLHWYYDREDDISEEFGQELNIDFPAMTFYLKPEN
ncbi:Fe-S oxidoreductase [Erwinia sp. OLTSP20]|uniref:DUF1987 domain-containing protein n=1 Tax=unclassified Erwinia TaxID=2622719 RepID=UPI000C1A5E1A|nr:MULTISPECIES: DUF1987 domain-containing protein [unclassified Erwinia]PIJ48886.1 Fe-S oxidoreductase [Erwinia sp. OAMSP11]PIJ74539.1 Fe-S oxidoreductase [Erwinia sp. OLSSP12]PIJ79570.1 Fe-S oxidoreductase [Erwinia sp. OLCASP19]PIJ80355.1 Fe-S oxidoreductase [Erwinia sp. OLMTSP26]PIJ82470.1 Fe-S oxidoreductase [Erwinia sp. OLMDSP33]